jgi:hypothetical protein
MKKLLISLIVMAACLPALAEGGWNTFIEWRGWRISSNEGLWAGHKHTAYPLTYLVDGDPNTAWVFSGTEAAVKDYKYYHHEPYHQWIEIDGHAYADSIRIMNGYNRSPELFARNNRITQIKLIINDKTVKTVDLSDKMGWHEISFPRRLCHSIKLVFTGIRKGSDNDTCISELALYDMGTKIDFALPKMVLYSTGETGDADAFDNNFIMTASGKIVFRMDDDTLPVWSPSRRRIAFADSRKSGEIWIRIVDVAEGRSICYKQLATLSKDDYIAVPDDMKWVGETTFLVDVAHPTGRTGKHGGDEETSYTRKIRIDRKK